MRAEAVGARQRAVAAAALHPAAGPDGAVLAGRDDAAERECFGEHGAPAVAAADGEGVRDGCGVVGERPRGVVDDVVEVARPDGEGVGAARAASGMVSIWRGERGLWWMYRPFMSWPVPLTVMRMFRSAAQVIAVATCSAVVALTIYSGSPPSSHPLLSS